MPSMIQRTKNGGVLLLAIATFFHLASCQQQEKVNLSGFLEAERYNIVSEVQGRIAELLKNEGDSVKKGEPFAILDPGSYGYSVKQLEQTVLIKQARLEELLNGARPQEVDAAEGRVEQARAGYDAARKGLETVEVNLNYAKEKYEDVRELYSQVKVTEADLTDMKFKVDSAQKSYEEMKEKVASAKASLDIARSQYQLLLSGASQEAVRMAREDLEGAKNALEGGKVVLEKYTVKAPVDGVLSLKSRNVGEVVNPGSNLGEILQMQEMYVKLYVPQKYLNRVARGKAVTMNSYSDKKLTVKGIVSSISTQAEFTPKNIETNEEKESTVFMVKVKITGNNPGLKPGMTFETNL